MVYELAFALKLVLCKASNQEHLASLKLKWKQKYSTSSLLHIPEKNEIQIFDSLSCQQDSNVYDLPVDKISASSHGLKCYMFLWKANGSCKKTKLLHQGRTERKLLH